MDKIGQSESSALHRSTSTVYYAVSRRVLVQEGVASCPAAGEAVSRVTYTHGSIGKSVVDKPIELGHNSAGAVHTVGSAVKSLKVDDKVAIEPGVPCRRCVRCLKGSDNLCPVTAFAATPPYEGTLAKFLLKPEDFCYKLPPNVSMQEGAMLEPTAVAVHFCPLAKVYPGNSVVLFRVNTRAYAKKHGATHVFQSKMGSTPQETADRIIVEGGLGEAAEVVIDASGHSKAFWAPAANWYCVTVGEPPTTVCRQGREAEGEVRELDGSGDEHKSNAQVTYSICIKWLKYVDAMF
ncbi:hypothetical protein PHYPSEUDO_011162 [Phytophthora pseudosyringae]|uniref:Alcohol dehydrogenase-like N-terminal domain-containing protein n=1 Tax=Phytophthora pseudosyringae TaxID=221518 RepID=A0A8T1VDV1_9STRA|nr:hypothetical protein PHYPSEUDO_011162 [Phytophthora pseudosyringae]